MAGLAVPSLVSAQDRWSVELAGGAAMPTTEPGAITLDAGFGGEGRVAYRFMPHLSAYAGWDWHRFAIDTPAIGAETDLEETGYAFGLQFQHPIAGTDGLALAVRLGATLNHLELENAAGEITSDSGHGVGWEGGVGIAIPMGDRWQVTPGVRFRSTEREFTSAGSAVPAALRYVTVAVGFSRAF
jgi:hypothetical protein